jgi:hypothetical protein
LIEACPVAGLSNRAAMRSICFKLTLLKLILFKLTLRMSTGDAPWRLWQKLNECTTENAPLKPKYGLNGPPAHFFGTSAEFWLNLQSLYENPVG